MRDKKICFIALNASFLFSSQKLTGGSELQILNIGQELLKRGWVVSFIIHKAPKLRPLKQFKLYPINAPKNKTRSLKSLFEKINVTIQLFRMLKFVDADIYYHRSMALTSPLTGIFCKIFYKKKYVYAGAHIADFSFSKRKLKYANLKYLYLLGLFLSDLIITQTSEQKIALDKLMNKQSITIPNGVPYIFPIQQSRSLNIKENNYIIWVATIKFWKKPWIPIKLAEDRPQYQFVMIGSKDPAGSLNLYNFVKNKANQLDNLLYLDFQPYQTTDNYIRNAKIFLNTSEYEGFPNTFLQAWNYGVPVISQNVDPDGSLANNKTGYLVKRYNKILKVLDNLMGDENNFSELKQNSESHVKENYNYSNLGFIYNKIFKSLLKQ